MKQSDIFIETEGDAWLARNRLKLGQGRDLVSEMIEDENIIPDRVLEIGCSNGWRLDKLRNRYRCDIWGVEPSMKAGVEAANLRVPILQCTAANLRGVIPSSFDLIIYGFCLYVTDPEDWLQIAAESDAILKPGGNLIVHDFPAGMTVEAQPYAHDRRLTSYHFDFAQLWLAHPRYSLVRRRMESDEMVVILKKLKSLP